jgi:hypothetical protein
MQLRVSMADIGLSLIIIKGTSLLKPKMFKKLITISVVSIAFL